MLRRYKHGKFESSNCSFLGKDNALKMMFKSLTSWHKSFVKMSWNIHVVFLKESLFRLEICLTIMKTLQQELEVLWQVHEDVN